MGTEHTIYSVSPKSHPQSSHCIREGWGCLGVPWHMADLSPGLFVLQVPQPYHRIKAKTHCGGTLGTLTFEALHLLATKQLFRIFESVFDRPSATEAADHLFAFHCEIGSDEKVVRPFAARIASDDHQQRFFAYMVPDDFFGKDKHGSFVFAFGDNNFFPFLYSLCQQKWFFQSFSTYAWSSPSGLCLWFGQIENNGVFSHVRYDLHTFGSLAYQGCVKTVAMANKAPFGQPRFDLAQHLRSQLDMAWPIFDSQPHIDWQADGFAFPRRYYSQGDHHQVQPTRESGKHIRKYRVSPLGCSLNVFARSAKESIVHVEIDLAFWTEHLYQQQREDFPKTGQLPACFVEESMKGIVGLCEKLRREGHNSRNGVSGRAQDPPVDQSSEDLSGWSGKNWKKVFENLTPCRCNNSIHTDLRVLMIFLSKTSESQYVRAQFSCSHSQKVRKLSNVQNNK
jgi:hypothetical protein